MPYSPDPAHFAGRLSMAVSAATNRLRAAEGILRDAERFETELAQGGVFRRFWSGLGSEAAGRQRARTIAAQVANNAAKAIRNLARIGQNRLLAEAGLTADPSRLALTHALSQASEKLQVAESRVYVVLTMRNIVDQRMSMPTLGLGEESRLREELREAETKLTVKARVAELDSETLPMPSRAEPYRAEVLRLHRTASADAYRFALSDLAGPLTEQRNEMQATRNAANAALASFDNAAFTALGNKNPGAKAVWSLIRPLLEQQEAGQLAARRLTAPGVRAAISTGPR